MRIRDIPNLAPDINDTGQVAFFADIDFPSSPCDEAFVRSALGGAEVIALGWDPACDFTSSGSVPLAISLSDGRRLVLRADPSNGQGGQCITAPERRPRWPSAWLRSWSAGCGGARSQRRLHRFFQEFDAADGRAPTCATALVAQPSQLLSDILIAAATRALAHAGVWRSSEMAGPAIAPLCM